MNRNFVPAVSPIDVHNNCRKMICLAWLLVGILVFAGGCGKKPIADSDSNPSNQSESLDPPVDMARGYGERNDNEYQQADYRILFIGNSHTSTCQMPKMVQTMLNKRQSKQKIYCEIRAGSFLVDHLRNQRTTDRIKQGKWDIVVLQAQKYSVSGQHDYPYDAALELTKMANAIGAKVIMYPEWGQRRNKSAEELKNCLSEAKRVHQLHETIVRESGATIAPVGLAWNAALESHPDWTLHSDGNHANRAGAILTARVFEYLIAADFLSLSLSENPQGKDHIVEDRISSEMQSELTQIAYKVVQEYRKQKNKAVKN